MYDPGTTTSATAKKLQKAEIFCFRDGWIAAPG